MTVNPSVKTAPNIKVIVNNAQVAHRDIQGFIYVRGDGVLAAAAVASAQARLRRWGGRPHLGRGRLAGLGAGTGGRFRLRRRFALRAGAGGRFRGGRRGHFRSSLRAGLGAGLRLALGLAVNAFSARRGTESRGRPLLRILNGKHACRHERKRHGQCQRRAQQAIPFFCIHETSSFWQIPSGEWFAWQGAGMKGPARLYTQYNSARSQLGHKTQKSRNIFLRFGFSVSHPSFSARSPCP